MNRSPRRIFNTSLSDPENWGSPDLVDLYRLLKKRAEMADSDTPGKRACAEFAQKLFSEKAVRGMSRTPRNPTPQDAQAMKAIQRIPASQIALIAAAPAAQQLSKISQQEKFPATVAPSDEVRGEVSRAKTPDWKKEGNRT